MLAETGGLSEISFFHLRRQDGVVHFATAWAAFAAATRDLCGTESAQLVSVQLSVARAGSVRLQEIAEDMHTLGVTAAALQFTRWKSGDPRSEWIVYNRDGHARFSCFSWGKPVNNKMLGVQLLVSHRLLQSVCIHTRFDPPRSLHGRLGGLRITSRTKGVEMDDLFVTAYAPQESDEEQRPLFFQALMEILHSVPKCTRVWLLGDFNGHVGHNSRSTAVGPQATDVTNNNGMSLVHACESAGLLLANTYSGWGPTCWTPDGRHSHCIDFIAVPLEFRSRVRRCRVNKVLGKRWQMSPVRDHWPVEVVVALPKPWTLLKGSTQTVRWNKHALQVALDDVSVGNKIFRECEQASHDVPRSLPDRPSREEVEHHWQHLQSELHQVAVRHFSMRPSQKSCKILPGTFDLLQLRTAEQVSLLDHVESFIESWSANNIWRPIAWFFRLFKLSLRYSRLRAAAKFAVKLKRDEKAWLCKA